MTGRAPLWFGLGLVVSGLVFLAIGAATDVGDRVGPGRMMGGGPTTGTVPGPDSPGFVPGTAAAPRVVRILGTAQLRFTPDTVIVKQGETITFEVTSMGQLIHEFMVGPVADVAADTPGTPEIADIGMMETLSVTYTFEGPGPYAYACHETGHYEAGMAGAITIVP